MPVVRAEVCGMTQEEQLVAAIARESLYLRFLIEDGHLWIGEDAVYSAADTYRVLEMVGKIRQVERWTKLLLGLPFRVVKLRKAVEVNE